MKQGATARMSGTSTVYSQTSLGDFASEMTEKRARLGLEVPDIILPEVGDQPNHKGWSMEANEYGTQLTPELIG